MKGLVTALLVAGVVSGVQAFDSAAWLASREPHLAEIERLRVAYTNCVAQLQVPAENVTIPIETFEDGAVKSIVYARKAMYFLDSGLVWAEGIDVKKFKADGSLDGHIEAERCVIDRLSKSGWAEGPAKVTHGKTTITGEDVYFSSPEGFVRVTKNARIVSLGLEAEANAL